MKLAVDEPKRQGKWLWRVVVLCVAVLLVTAVGVHAHARVAGQRSLFNWYNFGEDLPPCPCASEMRKGIGNLCYYVDDDPNMGEC